MRTALIGLFLTTTVAFAQDGAPRHPKYPRWITSYPAARKVAEDAGKPLLVVLRCEP